MYYPLCSFILMILFLFGMLRTKFEPQKKYRLGTVNLIDINNSNKKCVGVKQMPHLIEKSLPEITKVKVNSFAINLRK